MDAAPYVLHGVRLGCDHYEKVWDPVKHRYRRMRTKNDDVDPAVVDSRTMEEKGYILRRRSQVRSDEEIVEVVKHRGEVLPRRPRPTRRSSSYDGDYRSKPNYSRDAGGYGSESEGSVPPRSRNGRPQARAQSQSGRSRPKRSSSSSTTSSSQLGSTTEEEKECNKIRRKKWITAGLATVATVHAASKVYSSIENHDKRIIEVQQGKLSPDEAHKRARAARWQDAAAIGIAALGIKGALGEWKEMKEERDHHKELLEKHQEQHLRRLEHERRKKAREMGGYYKGRDGNWYHDGPDTQNSQRERARSQNGQDHKDGRGTAVEGPRANERKMIEGPPGDKGRSRSAYGRTDRSGGREGSDSPRAPSLATSRRAGTWNDGDDSRRKRRDRDPAWMQAVEDY